MGTVTHILIGPDGETLSVEELLLRYGSGQIDGYKCNIVAKTSNYTVTHTDDVILCGAGNESFTVTLLPVSAIGAGKVYLIKNVGTGTITVDADGGETIDGSPTVTLNQYDCVQIESDATGWWVL